MKDGQTFGQWLNWNFEANGSLEILGKKRRVIYFESADEYWCKFEYDSDGNVIYEESLFGIIVDHRTPEVIEHNGKKYQLIPNQNPQP